MLGEYKLGRCSRQCYKLERPLREGEWYFSVVMQGDDDDYHRRDYSAEAWDGPPEGAVGHWKCRMPKSDERKLVLAPKEVLIGLLRQMEHFPDKAQARYLLALTMLRKRILRVAPADPDGATDVKMLRVEIPEDGSIIEIPDCLIARSESDKLLEELNELLYCEASELESEELEG